jgi:hypothetical protein
MHTATRFIVSKREMFLKLKPFIIEYTSHTLIILLGIIVVIYYRDLHPAGFVFALAIFLPALLYFVNQSGKILYDLYKLNVVSGTFQIGRIHEVNFDALPSRKYYEVMVSRNNTMTLITSEYLGKIDSRDSVTISYFEKSKVILNISKTRKHGTENNHRDI